MRILNKLIVNIIIFIVKIYQHTISVVLQPSCRFSPSCSQYMIDSVKMHGPFRGFFGGVKRILRCHPFSKSSGWDPVK
ncbi:MAG: membrane protein insertion efficiency factor YidD [Candidatus Marinimicrobia bacterium]|nr:membrane protein insertion efficiency factor YidD [Candidatus Neomarinimicrobiota bacterium]MBL7023314.1 membrane protein insertion efficiency factor YidD [Candidatus Neomarinimicrobiota bacterium]